jgi:hypothetical protein
MSLEMLDRVYGHHHPDHLRTAARAMSFGRRVSLTEPLTAHPVPRMPVTQTTENIGGGRSRCRARLLPKTPCEQGKEQGIFEKRLFLPPRDREFRR